MDRILITSNNKLSQHTETNFNPQNCMNNFKMITQKTFLKPPLEVHLNLKIARKVALKAKKIKLMNHKSKKFPHLGKDHLKKS